MFENLIVGLNFVTDPTNFAIIIIGVVLGILVGILPGLGSTAAVAIMIPVTFTMTPTQAIAMLGALYAASTTGGSITAILFRVPGESSSAVAVLDGYPMGKKGKGGRALGLAAISSAIGGIFSSIVLMTLAPQLAKVALSFDQAEYFAITIFALSAVISLGSKSQLKSAISLFIGLFVVTIGVSDVTGIDRFVFDSNYLRYGVSLTAVAVGLFGFSEFLRCAATPTSAPPPSSQQESGHRIRADLTTIKDFWRMKVTVARSLLIGTFLGILPGTGSTISSIISYNEAVRSSKTPEKFGTGVDEGIVAPEVANNAATGGSLVPTLTLGIPGSGTTAVILAAMISHGLTPGPLLFTSNSELVWGVLAAFLMANVLMLVVGLTAIWMVVKVLSIPGSVLNVFVFLLCVMGAFGINNNLIDVWIMLIFGLLGVVLEKYDYPLMPLVVGIILGPMIENALETGLIIYGSFWPFVTRPIGGTVLVLALIALAFPTLKHLYGRTFQRTN